MPAIQKPFIVTLKRVVEITMIWDGASAADVRKQLSDIDMDDLQHMGNIASDECKIASVKPR